VYQFVNSSVIFCHYVGFVNDYSISCWSVFLEFVLVLRSYTIFTSSYLAIDYISVRHRQERSDRGPYVRKSLKLPYQSLRRLVKVTPVCTFCTLVLVRQSTCRNVRVRVPHDELDELHSFVSVLLC